MVHLTGQLWFYTIGYGMVIHGEEILCNFENNLSSVFKISASENVEIPPSSEMILPGKIQNGLPHIT
jgi:hypothetical protein